LIHASGAVVVYLVLGFLADTLLVACIREWILHARMRILLEGHFISETRGTPLPV